MNLVTVIGDISKWSSRSCIPPVVLCLTNGWPAMWNGLIKPASTVISSGMISPFAFTCGARFLIIWICGSFTNPAYIVSDISRSIFLLCL